MLEGSEPERENVVRRGAAALLSREAGYSVAQKCLEVQAEAERLDPTLRTRDRVTLHADAWAWYVGALGEIKVGSVLTQLGPEWMVRHAVPIGAGTTDVDHLVVGPGGVFALNTKHSASSSVWVGDHVLKVNNQNTFYLTRSRGEAASAAERLSAKVGFDVPVTSILVFVDPYSIKDVRIEKRSWPVVVASTSVVSAIVQATGTLSTDQLAQVRRAAEDPATWHVDVEAAHTFRVMQRFNRLVAAVGATPLAPQRIEEVGAGLAAWRPPSVARRAPSKPRSVPSRAKSSRPRLSKRQANRRARRQEDVVKLVLMLIALLTYPLWSPMVFAMLSGAMTP
jgi:hypothetical protein